MLLFGRWFWIGKLIQIEHNIMVIVEWFCVRSFTEWITMMMRLHIYPCTLWYGKSRVPPLFYPFMFFVAYFIPHPLSTRKPTIKNVLDKLKIVHSAKTGSMNILQQNNIKRIYSKVLKNHLWYIICLRLQQQ